MKKNWKGPIFFLVLGITAAAAIVTSSRLAQPKIDEHLDAKRRAQIEKMLPANQTDLTIQTFQLLAPNYLKMGDTQTAARLIRGNQTIEVIYMALSPKAYRDKIAVMASFDQACTIGQVDIINEKETPGLGDQYKKNDYAWLKTLAGKTAATKWALKPQGDIDSWTGATVTPKAIVLTLERMQSMCMKEHDSLFSAEPYVYLELGKPDE